MSNQAFHAHRDNPGSYTHSAGQSKVGAANIYGDDDQRNIPESEVKRVSRESGHNLRGYMADHHSKHQHQGSMAQIVSDEKEKMHPRTEADLAKKDPTLPAQMHNNEPSRGAKIDAELMKDDAEELRRKGLK